MAKIDLRNRRPKMEKLPDGRQRATFAYDVREWVGRTKAEILSECWLAWGTEAPGDFTGFRLIKQDLEGLRPNDNGSLPLVRVFEELPASEEIQVGENAVQLLDDGRKAIVAEFLQFSSATATPGTIGTTTAPGDTSAFLQNEEAPSDGTLRRIKRTYVYAGTLSQSDASKNGGKLLTRTVVAVKTEPATPVGYTRVDADVKSPNGIPVYTYTFAKGSGRISTDVSYKQNGKLKIITIRYLDTDDGAVIAGTLVNDDRQSQDGYTIYTKGYAEIVGDGIVSSDVEIRNHGKLKLYRIVRLGSVPDTPAASIGGTVVSTATDTRQEDGFTLYDYHWAEGRGRISTETSHRQNGKVQVTTIRYLASDDGATPSGTLVNDESQTQDGVTLYTQAYSQIIGDGIISNQVETRSNGKLVLYRTVRLGSPPSTPSATIGGTVVSTATDTREEDGFTIYDYRWAEGDGRISIDVAHRHNGKLTLTTVRYLGADDGSAPTGTLIRDESEQQEAVTLHTKTYAIVVGDGIISTDTDTRHKGKLVLYRIVRLGSAPGAPAPTIGGTVVSVTQNTRLEDGVTIHDYRWAEGYGRISLETEEREAGSLVISTVRYFATDDAAAPTGHLISTRTTKEDGVDLITKVYANGSGEISRETEYRQSTDQGVNGITITTIRRLEGPAAEEPFWPEPTTVVWDAPAGTVKVTTSFQSRDGYGIWTGVFAKGAGTVIDEVETKIVGRLVLYRKVALALAPTTPAATIGGTVVSIQANSRRENGFLVYDYRWAEGKGTIQSETTAREDGSIVYQVISIDAVTSTPAYPGAGTAYLVKLTHDAREGHWVSHATYIKPPADYTRPVQVEFRKPGLVIAGNPPVVTPPATLDLMGTETVTFSTTKTNAVPYKVSAFSTLYEVYKASDDGITYSKVDPLQGYVGSSNVVGSNTTYRGVEVETFSVTVSGSNPTTLPVGVQTLAVRCEKYLTATDGTTIWRNAVVTADVT